jgi:hypothetical protein
MELNLEICETKISSDAMADRPVPTAANNGIFLRANKSRTEGRMERRTDETIIAGRSGRRPRFIHSLGSTLAGGHIQRER